MRAKSKNCICMFAFNRDQDLNGTKDARLANQSFSICNPKILKLLHQLVHFIQAAKMWAINLIICIAFLLTLINLLSFCFLMNFNWLSLQLRSCIHHSLLIIKNSETTWNDDIAFLFQLKGSNKYVCLALLSILNV